MTDTPSRPLKTLIILPSLTAGGAERVLITLMNGLNRSEFAPSLCTIDDTGPLKKIIAPDIPYITLGKRGVIRALPDLYKTLKNYKPEIVVSTMAHMNFAVLLLSPFFKDTKFIVREAITPSFILKKHPLLAPFLKAAYRCLYKRAALVISPARIIIDEFAHDLNMDISNHHILHNPVDMKKIRCQEQTPPPQGPNCVQFICAGRLSPQKGFDVLIEHLSALTLPDWHLTILGEGPQKQALDKRIARHGLHNHVTLAGHSEQPWPAIAGADAFLLPSLYEGLPNVALESLACGTPVIALQSAGGIDEIQKLAHPGDVIITKDMTSFIQAMNNVTPQAKTRYTPSRLPAAFEREKAIARFAQLLKSSLPLTS